MCGSLSALIGSQPLLAELGFEPGLSDSIARVSQKCGPQTKIISWKLVRNAHSQALP